MIDPKKQYCTSDGREVRIYAVDGGANKQVHGAYATEYGWTQCSWPADGMMSANPTPWDLIEVKPRIKREVWVNEYRNDIGKRDWAAFNSRQDADDEDHQRIACIKLTIDCEEGEGL